MTPMQPIPWALLFQSVAVVNAMLLAAALLLSPRLYRTRARVRLAGLLAAYGLALGVFTAMDMAWLRVSLASVAAEYTLALLAGALLVDFVAGSVGLRSRVWPVYALPGIFPLAAAILGQRLLGEAALIATIALQSALTALATVIFWRAGRALLKRPRHVLLLLVATWVFHLFQLLRLSMPSVAWLFDAVPLLAATMMLGLTVFVVMDPRSLRVLAQEPGAVPAGDGPDLAKVEAYMREERPFLTPDLDLQGLSRALGYSPRALSATLNRAGQSFYEFVHRHRVEEARRLLEDPAERRTSIEAIGLMVGFRSRSTFYEAFRKITGSTPAEYRRDASR